MTEELFRDDSYLKNCEATVAGLENGAIVLDRTVFYPMGGGQPGDIGTLKTASGVEILITDTQKDKESGTIFHVFADGAPLPSIGETVTAEINWDRRYSHMRMHTCLHLLCNLVEGGITGASIGADKSRVDFNIPDDPPDKQALSEALMRLVTENHSLALSWITDEELERNPGIIRSMSVKPPTGAGRVRVVEIEGVDLQPCGGTHVKATGEIGAVRVSKIENKGKCNRRISVVFDQ